MHDAYGISYSADAAATLARAAAGIGGTSSQASVTAWKLKDGMFRAFCKVCGDDPLDVAQKLPIELSPDRILRMLDTYAWMLERYPWIVDRYPQIFKTMQTANRNRRLQ